MAKHRSFTNFLDELQNEQITFEYKGATYTLPPSLPLGAMLQVIKLQKEQDIDHDLTPEDTFTLFELVLGKEQFAALVEQNITVPEMSEIFRWVMEQYGDSNNPKTEARKAK